GDFVWVDPGVGVPIGAEVQLTDTGQLQLLDDEGKHKVDKKNEGRIRQMHPSSVTGVDDMIMLGDLNEEGLLRNLLVRHKEGKIYQTYTGSILVAVNPYQLLPIYTTDHVHMYTDQRLGELPPHVFAIADSCFFNMRRNRKNQCCVIGESGAGKTESTKLMLQYLAAVSGQHSWIEQQILEANPILEFGNAKTIRNDNSSRFGKYIDVNFNKSGAIEGARIEQYLLEKSRVIRQAPEERNYHIFYYMLMGMSADQKKILSLGTAADYKYLTMGNCTSCEGRDDVKEFAHFRSALKILTFSEADSWEIFKLLAAILHLGNVEFETIVSNMEGCELCKCSHFNMASQLLEVDPKALETSLTQRSVSTIKETVSKFLTRAQAVDGRDAFVKALYGKLFIWVVNKINSAVYKTAEEDKDLQQSIGLLDIFGFENFTKNFEQLCINFANEQLQQFFVKHVFKLEQDEYSRENIVWKHIEYQDNQKTLDVLASKTMNMLALIDEESNFPKGTDTTLLQKMNQFHEKGNVYIRPKNVHETVFGIRHFAGEVYYDSQFLEKNRDAFSSDMIQVVEASTNKLLRQTFQNELSSSSKTIKSSSNPRMKTPEKKRVPTLIGQFRQSLDSLMKTLSACQPYFIRCIKPNDFKRPMLFDRDLCMRQLRYSGMMETIKIRKAGYPVRYTFKEFLDRYRVLLKTSICNPESEEKCCETICKSVLKEDKDWKTGKTKIFLKDIHDTKLEVERMIELNTKALLIQRVLRGYKYREFLKKRSAAIVLQKNWRGHKGRKLFKMVQLGFARLQAQVRSRHLHLQYKRKRQAALVLQTHIRGYQARKEWQRKRNAVIVLQTHTRGVLARRALQKMKRDMYLSAKEKEAEQRALLEKQKHLEEILWRRQQMEAQKQSESMSAMELVDDMFGFLPDSVGGQEGQAPVGFENIEGKRTIIEEIDIDELPIEENLPQEDYDDLDEFTFSKFASMYFQGGVTSTYIRQRLRKPLLFHEDEEDVQASLTVWWIILRFMGDLPEPKKQTRVQLNSPQERFMPQDLVARKDRRLSHMVGLDQNLQNSKVYTVPEGNPRARKGSTFTDLLSRNKKTPVIPDNEDIDPEEPTLDRPLTSLEKLHIIVGYGIVRQDLDEIFCQICKQLQDNSNTNSCLRGWILLSLCLGVFPPSDRFTRYLQSFIRGAPRDFASYCAERLRRTRMNGARGEPPAWLELQQATKTRKPMIVSVRLMNGVSINVPVDSATTSKEICQMVCNKIKLTDSFGFSLYVAMYEKVWALGSARDHVMDAISQCEQEVKRKGGQERHAPWRLVIRKEIFTPWHDCKKDKVSTDLIYKQIIQGLKFGEYQSKKEDDIVELTAKHLYIQHGHDSRPDYVKEAVQECVSNSLLEAKSEAKWVQMVSTAHSQFVSSRKTEDAVKAEIVDFAREEWPIFFSRFFEVTKVSPPLQKSKFIVAINWTGITFLDEREKRLLELSFPEVTGVNSSQAVCLLTLKGDFTLSGSKAEDMGELITMFLGGLTERSQYAVALKDASGQDPTLLNFKKGDLIIIIKDNELLEGRGWVKGENDSTRKRGAVPVEAILILPTLTKPTNEIMSLINLPPNQRKNLIQTNQKETGTVGRAPLATLKEFSVQYFQPIKDVNRQVISRNAAPERLWAHSREPIRQPFLQKLVGNPELSQKACLAFTILKYMGDYPTRQVQNPLELTDQIFSPATENEALRDEIYCQIMKQMTSNNNIDQGWQLLWLCCGLFPPSQALLKHTQRFLETRRRDALASDCLQRLQSSLMEPRKLPPHHVEVDAIQQNSTKIFHKIHFPNDTMELQTLEVATGTKVRDLIKSISKKLNLISADGYSLFVKAQDKVISLNDTDYFFDSLRQITDWSKKSKQMKDGPVNIPYLVFFMRKLWFNVIPGKDTQADLIFHFPQEVPKYLRGYHTCSKDEMVNIAALLFRSKFGKDNSQMAMLTKMLKELVPADQLKAISENEWKKQNIATSYNKQGNMTADEAKVGFLKAVSRWPTFGCAFFEVKFQQTSEPSFPDIVRIAISKLGLTIIHPKTKEVLATHPFNRIASWCSGSTYFHMTIGSLVKGNKFLCETSLGYKMDDLITSYVSVYLRDRRPAQTRNQRFNM
uniref:Si:ch73-194h10.2 n=1 Tax=Oryzias latipes TaxID=8090 RepID=A0A3P9LF06_ORYLA